VTLDIFIERVHKNLNSKQMIVVMFNAQSTVIRRIVLFRINEERIKNIREYKDFCESTIARENINYLEN